MNKRINEIELELKSYYNRLLQLASDDCEPTRIQFSQSLSFSGIPKVSQTEVKNDLQTTKSRRMFTEEEVEDYRRSIWDKVKENETISSIKHVQPQMTSTSFSIADY